MLIEVKVPQLPESVSEATLTSWKKRQGDFVRRDENLVDLETDKIVLEIPAPHDGILVETIVADNSIVTSGQILARIDPSMGNRPVIAAQSVQEEVQAPLSGPFIAMPAAERLAAEKGIDLASIHGSGRDGRILKEDVQAALHIQEQMPSSLKEADSSDAGTSSQTGQERMEPKSDTVPVPVSVPAPASVPVSDFAPQPAFSDRENRQPPSAAASAPVFPPVFEGSSVSGSEVPGKPVEQNDGVRERREPMSRLRQAVAGRLILSQQTNAILTTFNEVNMKPLLDLRSRYKAAFEKEHGVKLGIMSFFVKAAIHALKKYPVINARIEGTDIVYNDYYDIGVAIGAPRGLIVPILRNADRLSIADIERKIADFGMRAQEGRIGIEEMNGGTYTITNGGVFGSMMSTPIINPPQSAILGMHATKERPVAENGEIVIRPMMYLAQSYDHRLIDGREAVLSLTAIKDALEDPARMLLDI